MHFGGPQSAPLSHGTLLGEREDVRWLRKQCLEVWVQGMEVPLL